MIMGHCSCCAHTHECAPEKHIEKKESIFAEYWKVGLSFILLISGIIMNALELPFFREGYFSLIWYVKDYRAGRGRAGDHTHLRRPHSHNK